MTSREYPVDEALLERAIRYDARAATRPDVLPDRDARTMFPRYATRGEGAYLWDSDGHRFIDFLLGYGPILLGHSHPAVTDAAIRQLALGNCFSPLWSERQVELSEMLCEVIPGAEMALLLKTGSDATSAAVRLARIFTGRDKIVRWGYNGWHDWSVWQSPGVPRSVRELSLTYDSTTEGLSRVFEQHRGEIAAVVRMPVEHAFNTTYELQKQIDLAHGNGALMIFDEMRTGFRMSLGGAQEFFSVTPDLATFSKGMANGYPISAVTGRREILERLSATKISSAYFAGPVEMAAALATIRVLQHSDALARIWRMGERLQAGLRRLIESYGVPAAVTGYPPFPFLAFEPGGYRTESRHRFYEAVAASGVLLHPDHQWFVSAAHTEADVDAALQACEAGFQRLRRPAGIRRS